MKEIIFTGSTFILVLLFLFMWVTPANAAPPSLSQFLQEPYSNKPQNLQEEQPETPGTPENTVQSTPPTITVWYENTLRFGHIGNPQGQINIPGNVRDPDGSISSLTFRLNGGSPVTMELGPDGRRLENQGDFNAAINTSSLRDGANTLLLTAVDNSGDKREKTVTFYYTKDRTWPIPYATNWNAAANIHEQAQVIDGLWELDGGGLRPVQVGYDRVVGVGDMIWKDYEVVVPITVHGFYPDPDDPIDAGGVGIIARWQGHQGSGQLPDDWTVLGAYAYYSHRRERLALRLNASSPLTETYNFNLNTTYIFKLRAETSSQGGKYSFKIWEKGQPEPSWDSSAFNNLVNVIDTNDELDTGSVLLVAHRADATFGDVTICPIDQPMYSLQVNQTVGGSVDVSPEKSQYNCGEGVTLTAQPVEGWEFAGWSGGINSTSNPLSINMTRSYSVTANFQISDFIELDYKNYMPVIGN